MSKKNKKTSSKISPKKRKKSRKIKRTLSVISGWLLIIFSVYSALAMTSYLINWFQSKVSIDIETAGFWNYLINSEIHTHNFTGKFGDVISTILIKQWFGISSFLLLTLLFHFGIKLIFRVNIFRKRFYTSAILFITLWLSTFLALCLQNNNSNILAGNVGIYSYDKLNSIIGIFGTAIALGVILFVLLGLRYHINILKIFKKSSNEDSKTGKEGKTSGKKDKYGNLIEEDTQENFREGLNNNKDNDEVNDDEDNDEKQVYEDNDADNEIDTVSDDDISNKISNSDKEQADCENSSEDEEEDFTDKVENSEDLIVERPEEEQVEETDFRKHFTIDTKYDPTLDLPHYKMPTLDLLNDYDQGTAVITDAEIEKNRQNIKNTLLTYSIEITSIKATVGPTITLYEIVPAPGIRISKIKNLESDIALSLAAVGIRIIAPIPGKGTIGIEVPNSKPQIVSLKSVVSSKKFVESNYELPIALGKTISNESFVTDLTKMPHLLVAGATGQGKSVGLNAIIASLLYKKHPSQLKFVMVDPKKVELSLFSKIEQHYLAKLPDIEEPIITETKYVVNTLNSLLIEMDDRYNLLKKSGVRNIKEYNSKFVDRKLNPENGHRYLPYIVVIIDEFADLIMTAGREVETPLTRLAQLARATGIHLVIATQRPSVNIITGTIKANFPARLAFRVVQKIDSRTILDCSGADQLIGRGDMLLSTGSDLIRMQCAFVDTDEVMRITEFIGNQQGYGSALILPEYTGETNDNQSVSCDISDRDDMFEQAARLVVSSQHGSTSLIQRKLSLGYNRAGRIMDQLEAAGIVGPAESSKPREVYVETEAELDKILYPNS